jgi:hypothetical protein
LKELPTAYAPAAHCVDNLPLSYLSLFYPVNPMLIAMKIFIAQFKMHILQNENTRQATPIASPMMLIDEYPGWFLIFLQAIFYIITQHKFN